MVSTIDINRPNNGGKLATLTFSAESYRRWAVMGDHFVELSFSLPQVENGLTEGFLEIPIGSYVSFKGRTYTLYNPSDFKKNGLRNYEYSLKLYAYQELLYDRIFVNEPDGMTVYPRTARPEEFLTSIVRNMNYFDTNSWDGTEWTVGQCITSNVQQTVQFNGVSCMQALQDVAAAFSTEWEVNNKVISLKKVEYNRDAPLKLWYSGKYGADAQGGGFVAGVGRGNYDESRPVHKLYVKGGNRNIEFSTYGAQNLLLPKNATISFDGTYFNDETGYNSAIARQYTTSADGTYLTRTGVPQTSRREAFIELQEAYPKFVGIISRIIWKNGEDGTERTTYAQALADAGGKGENVFCDMFDTSIPAALDFSTMRIDGEQLVIVPQTGRLSGREIGVQQSSSDVTDGYIHSERRFKLITDADYGMFIPDDRLAVGDTYAVFGIDFYKATTGQQVYISNGERDLLKEAVRYKYENEDLRFTFTGTLDSIWVKRNYGQIDDKLVIGGYVDFSDPQFHPAGTLIRISALKDYLYDPEKTELELTNIVHGGGLKGELAEIPKQEVVINTNEREARRMSQRRWHDVQELQNNLGTMFKEFSNSISPVAVSSMQFVAGSKLGQFRFVTGQGSNTVASGAPMIDYDGPTNSFYISGSPYGSNSYLQHQTIGIPDMDGYSVSGTNGTSVRPASEYRTWTIPPYGISTLDKDTFYWVYARVNKNGTTGGYFVDSWAMDYFEDDLYYYLVVGALNSEVDGTRGWSPLFGFTEILPGQITTGMVRSQSGDTYFDLSSGDFRAGNGTTYLDWNTAQGRLLLQNAALNIQNKIVLNPNGSGYVASNNFSWDVNGNITARNITAQGGTFNQGTFNNVTVNGNITANAGKIGAFNISSSGDLTNNPNINEGAVIFRYDPQGIFAGIGTNVLPPSSGASAAARFENYSGQGGAAAYFAASENGSAILIGEGHISGFAVNAQQLTVGRTITNNDCYISCYNQSPTTFTLPAPYSMSIGKVVYFRLMNATTVYINGTIHVTGQVSSVTLNNRGDIAMFVNDGQFWCYNMIGR